MLVFISSHAVSSNTLPVVTVEFPPFGYSDHNNNATGASTEIVTTALARMGYTPNIDIIPTKRAQQMTEMGLYAALFTVTKSKQRATYCLFSDPIAHIADVFFKRKSDKTSWEQLEDVGTKIVGATDGYNYATTFQDAVRQGKLKTDIIADQQPELQHLKKLTMGRIDLAICERSVCTYLVKKHSPDFDSVDFIPKPIGPVRSFHTCFARKRADAPRLVTQFNHELKIMREKGVIQAILKKYGVVDTKN